MRTVSYTHLDVYKRQHVASVVTQVAVDPGDPAFLNPTKPIGSFMTKEAMEALKKERPELQFVEDSGRGYRRVVPSPRPVTIVERDSILNLLDNEYIVIALSLIHILHWQFP